jgi:hypothetical protein
MRDLPYRFHVKRIPLLLRLPDVRLAGAAHDPRYVLYPNGLSSSGT